MNVDWLLALKTLCGGIVLGAIFTWLRWPPPIPQALEGMMGIVGLWIGYFLVTLARRHFGGF